jgi:hypothetical protein
MSNTGGAWDNSKKYTEKGALNGLFPFREKTEDMEAFKKGAAVNNGNGCLENLGSSGKKLTEDQDAIDSGEIKTWLEDLKKKNKQRYEQILAGEEGIQTKDGRFVVYAGKKSNVHAAAVVGDTVGDPLKDTSGPALNIVMKLMAIISVVFADFFMSTNNGNGFFCAGDLDCCCRSRYIYIYIYMYIYIYICNDFCMLTNNGNGFFCSGDLYGGCGGGK